jgi:hypothetical protein
MLTARQRDRLPLWLSNASSFVRFGMPAIHPSKGDEGMEKREQNKKANAPISAYSGLK